MLLLWSTAYSQQNPDVATWPGNPILNKQITASQPAKVTNDIFGRGAITYQELERRALTHPYMPHEIVVAMEFNTPKTAVPAAVDAINWQILFGQNTSVIRTLMITQRSAMLSVALVT